MIRSRSRSRSQSHRDSRFSIGLLLLHVCIFLSLLPGIRSSGVVILKSIEIYTTHEILGLTPTVYFRCHGENKTYLPDVKKKNITYSFKGEESWQPLTELADWKCKRCGFYEEDILKSDDVFDEWEVCPDDFPPDGRHARFKEKEFNATFFCPRCHAVGSTHPSEGAPAEEKKSNVATVAVVAVVCTLVTIACIFGAVAGYKYWRKRRREQEQARFLKLFEDGDDIEDELGVDHI